MLSFTIPASSAPVAVMIFIVEPGGCRPEKPTPATASRRPLRGSITVIPAYRPAIAAIAARSIVGLIVVWTLWPGLVGVSARIRWPDINEPPGVPASCFWKIRSMPSRPTFASGG